MRILSFILAALALSACGSGSSSATPAHGVAMEQDRDGCLKRSNANKQQYLIGSNIPAEHHIWWCAEHEGVAQQRVDMLFEFDGTCRRLHKEIVTPGVCDKEPPQNDYPTIRASLDVLYPMNISDIPAERNNWPGFNLGYSLITYQYSGAGDYYQVGFGVEVTNTGTVPLYDAAVVAGPPAGSAGPKELRAGIPSVVMPGESFVVHGVQSILDFPVQGGMTYQYYVSLIDQFGGSAGSAVGDAKAAWNP